MDAARLKLGTNYLSQALHSTAVALPAPYGVGIAGRSPGVPPQEIVSKLEVNGGADVTMSAVAWCPAAPELLALAVDAERAVQLWKVQGDALAGSCIGEMPLPGPCRQLAWHPSRRLLAVVTPDSVSLLELAAPGRSQPKLRPLMPSETLAVRCCAWSGAGDALAVGCEGEVRLFCWPVVGMWDHHTCLVLPLPAHRLCALEHGGADASASIVLGVAPKISVAGGAGGALGLEMREITTSAPTPAVVACVSGAAATVAAAPAAAEVLDLRGKMASGGADPLRHLLDLSLELDAGAAAHAAAAHAAASEIRGGGGGGSGGGGGGGGLLVCGRVQPTEGGGAEVELRCLAAPVATALPLPDMLARPPPRGGSHGEATASLLVVGSSTSHQIVVFAQRPAAAVAAAAAAAAEVGGAVAPPLWALRTISLVAEGARCRGVACDEVGVLLALCGTRGAGAFFSVPGGKQELRVCAFDLSDDLRRASDALRATDDAAAAAAAAGGAASAAAAPDDDDDGGGGGETSADAQRAPGSLGATGAARAAQAPGGGGGEATVAGGQGVAALQTQLSGVRAELASLAQAQARFHEQVAAWQQATSSELRLILEQQRTLLDRLGPR